jgi:hypothetical protein
MRPQGCAHHRVQRRERGAVRRCGSVELRELRVDRSAVGAVRLDELPRRALALLLQVLALQDLDKHEDGREHERVELGCCHELLDRSGQDRRELGEHLVLALLQVEPARRVALTAWRLLRAWA